MNHQSIYLSIYPSYFVFITTISIVTTIVTSSQVTINQSINLLLGLIRFCIIRTIAITSSYIYTSLSKHKMCSAVEKIYIHTLENYNYNHSHNHDEKLKTSRGVGGNKSKSRNQIQCQLLQRKVIHACAIRTGKDIYVF